MTVQVTLSSKNQIVVPREARLALHVAPGDKILISVIGDTVVILPRPASFTEAIRGLSKTEHSADYLGTERNSWD